MYKKGINVNVLAESGQTDAETIAMYEAEIPGLSLDLVGKPELNDVLFAFENQQNLINIKQKALDDGYSVADATTIATNKSEVLLKNALANYEKLKKQRASSKA